MKALIEWIKNFLGLVKVEEVKPEPVVEEKLTPPQPPKAEPKTKAAPKAKAEPKVTKASLAKLTKAGIAEEGEKLGITVSTKLKKDEMIKQVLKQK